MKNHTALEAINHGFALVTEERRSTGIYSNLSIEFNSLISNMKSYLTPWKLLSNKKMASDTQWVIDAMNVKTLLTKQRLAHFLVVTNKSDYRPLAFNPTRYLNARRTNSWY